MSVFSVMMCLQFGQRAGSLSMNSRAPRLPVTSARIQSNGISASAGWQCSQVSISCSAFSAVAGSTVTNSMLGPASRSSPSKPLFNVHSYASSSWRREICLPFRGLHLKVRRHRLVRLIEHRSDLVDLLIQHELTWALVGFVAVVSVDVDRQRHPSDPTANSQFQDRGYS